MPKCLRCDRRADVDLVAGRHRRVCYFHANEVIEFAKNNEFKIVLGNPIDPEETHIACYIPELSVKENFDVN